MKNDKGELMFVAIDTETWLIQPGLLAPPLVCLSFCEKGKVPLLAGKTEALAVMRKYLDTKAIIVGHNIAYDCGVLCAQYPSLIKPIFEAYEAGRVRDTLIREKLDAISDGDLKKREMTLAALAKKYLKKDIDKGENTWRLRYQELTDVPISRWPKAASDYARTDAATTLEVFFAQGDGKEIADEPRQLRAAWALHLMGIWGLRTDGQEIERLEKKFTAEYNDLMKVATDAGLVRVNKKGEYQKDLKVIRERIKQKNGNKKTAKGMIATDAESMEETGDEILIGLTRAEHLRKLNHTYLSGLKGGIDHAMTVRWNSLVESGRTSATQMRLEGHEPHGAPLQQMPRKDDIRPTIIPRPGNAFIMVDYDTLELRTLAQVCKHFFKASNMATAINSGKDLHLVMAAQILGKSYEDLDRQKKDPSIKDARQFGKIANFGLPGGMGVASFVSFAWSSYRMRLDYNKAQALVNQWRKAWPEMLKYFQLISSWVGARGETSVTQLYSNRRRGRLYFTEACNTLFQGLAADGAKDALWQVTKACYVEPLSPLYGCRPVIFMHDEIILEAPKGKVHEAAEEMRRIMVDTMQNWVPDVKITASPSAALRWYKEAEEVRDLNGKLIPWERVAA